MPTHGRGSRPPSGMSDCQSYESESDAQSSQATDDDNSLEPARFSNLRDAAFGHPPLHNEPHFSLSTSQAECSESSTVSSENEEAPNEPEQSPFARNPSGNGDLSQRRTDVGMQRHSKGSQFSDPTVRGAPNQSTRPLDTVQAAAGTNTSGNDVQPIPEINICVLGAPNVGKTTFVKRTFNLRGHSILATNMRKMSLDGLIYKVRLLEVSSEDVDIAEDGCISWPESIGDGTVPRVDGALVLYSVMDSASLAPIARTLSALQRNAVPSVLVSCKCDNHPALREVDPAFVEQRAKSLIGSIRVLHTLETAPDTYKICMSVILRSIVTGRKEQLPNGHVSHSRAISSGSQTVSPRSRQHERNRAKSDISVDTMRTSAYYSHDPDAESEGSGARTPTSNALAGQSDTSPLTSGLRRPGDRPSFRQESNGRLHVSKGPAAESILVNGAARDSRLGLKGKPSWTFLDLEDESASAESTDATDSDEHNDDLTPSVEKDVQSKPAADGDRVTFESLVDRLLAQPASKADEKFVDIFLALYRKFSPPYDLLEQIIGRFDALHRSQVPQTTQTELQMRCLIVLERWSCSYPGDFAHWRTKRRAQRFAATAASTRILAVASKCLSANLNGTAKDDDRDWGCCDEEKFSRPVTADTSVSRSSANTSSSTLVGELDAERPSTEDIDGLTLQDDPGRDRPQRVGTDSTHSRAPGTLRISKGSTALTVLNAVQTAQRAAQALVPNPRHPFTKVQWHQLMDIPEELIARELTRIDWLMFISIRPRDLIRHVSLAPAKGPKVRTSSKSKALENVTRMTEHFNHLAYWVANLVLLRDKPKHRALGIEKLMRVARKLRELNNYNALGALVAGINSTPVHRLAATRDLVSTEIAKDFMKLEILMSTQKSHFAYRLAWENSSTERIPFLPLHRRDLVSAEQGSKTFVGEEGSRKLINWKKFEIMGDAVVGIMKAQDVPARYKDFVAQEEVKGLVLDAKLIKDDDELYERSVQVEPAGAGAGDKNPFKKWFQ